MRVRIDLAYIGTAFCGWQIQKGQRTVQAELTGIIARLLGREIPVGGAGRTDSGVHARGQVCHLDLPDPDQFGRLKRALPCLVPDDIQILNIRAVSPDFHARYRATARRYSYNLIFRPDIFRQEFAFLVRRRVDPDAMTAATESFLGTNDFTSFCKKRSLQPAGNLCQVDLCRFDWEPDSAIFHVRANRFLHHMVRNMIGTLLEVGVGHRNPGDIVEVLSARDRGRAGRMAPARGLFLEEVIYPPELLDPDHRISETAPGRGSAGEPQGDTE